MLASKFKEKQGLRNTKPSLIFTIHSNVDIKTLGHRSRLQAAKPSAPINPYRSLGNSLKVGSHFPCINIEVSC